MSNIDKILDRVRKMLALAEHSPNENEAALAASRAAKLMEEYQLSEAIVRLDDADAKPEAIEKAARLEPEEAETGRKRVAWKESVARAVADDLGVRMFFWSRYANGRRYRDVRGFGRESAIQTWRYTCAFLWRQVDELSDKAYDADDAPSWQSARAWKGAFRLGCAQRIAERIYENRQVELKARAKAREEALNDEPDGSGSGGGEGSADRQSLALTIVEKDRDEVDREYTEYSKTFGRSTPSIGSSSSPDGYSAGKRAGDRVSLGGKRAGLPAGQGRLKGGQ